MPGPTRSDRLPSMLTAATPALVASFLGFVLVALFLVPPLFGSFWTKIMIEWAAYSGVALGLNLLVGRAGIYSLCQVPLVAAGAWFSFRLFFLFNENLPFPLILIGAGLSTALLGVVIGLPAVRLSGLYLALVTLMAAGAITLLLVVVKFPNGGEGFWGFDQRRPSSQNILPRPGIAEGDDAYYRYVVIVVSLLFLAAVWHVKGKPGRAWASLRESELTAVSAGINTTLYKLWAFALSAGIGGVAGGLLSATSGVTTVQFPVQESILLLAVVMLGGVYNLWGAVVAGFFLRVFPQILDEVVGLPVEWLTALFGVGVLFTLLVQPRGVVQDLTNLGRLIGTKVGRTKPASTDPDPATEAVEDSVEGVTA